MAELAPISQIAGAHRVGGLDPLKRGALELEGLSFGRGGTPAPAGPAQPSLAPIAELQRFDDAPPAPAGDTERGYFEEFSGSFLHTLGPQNIQLFGSGVQHLGQVIQSKPLHDAGKSIKDWGKTVKMGEPATMPPVKDIDTALRWAAGGLGQGLGSIAIPIAGGGAGAAAGFAMGGPKGATVGGFGGAFTADYFVLVGEAADQFRQEGVDKVTAAKAAAAIGVPMAALDTAGVMKVLRGPLRKPKQALLSYIGKRIVHGASIESVTEMLQGVIREYTAADLTGKADVARRFGHILEEGAVAAMTGGVVGGGAGVVSRRRAQDPAGPPEEAAQAAEAPEATETAPEPETPAQDAPPVAEAEAVQETPTEATGPETDPAQEEFGELPPERAAAVAEVQAQQAENAEAIAEAQKIAAETQAIADDVQARVEGKPAPENPEAVESAAAVKAIRPEVEKRVAGMKKARPDEGAPEFRGETSLSKADTADSTQEAAPEQPPVARETEPAQAQESAKPPETEPEPMPEGRRSEQQPEGEVVTPAGNKVSVRPEVVELGDLTASHDAAGTENPGFPQELQPRDRSRSASRSQIATMAGNIEPSLLMPAAQASEGAPIVGPEGAVESGNARTIAISEAYARHPEQAAKYKAALQEAGYDVAGMKQPVLVQRRLTEMTPEQRAAFTREANQRTTAERSASEQAVSDAAELSPAVMSAFMGGEIRHAANRNFVRKFVETVVPTSERGGMVNKDGHLSQAGVRRIENTMFAAAYGDPELLGRLREDRESKIKSIGDAMIEAAPAWRRMRDIAQAGDIDPELDSTPRLLEAVALVERARTEGQKTADLINQADAFTGPFHPVAEAYMRILFRNSDEYVGQRGKPKLVNALNYVAEDTENALPNLMGETPDAETVVRGVAERLKREEAKSTAQADLLGEAANARVRQSLPPDGERGAVGGGTPVTVTRGREGRRTGRLTPERVGQIAEGVTASWDPARMPAVHVVDSVDTLPEDVRAKLGDGARSRGVYVERDGAPAEVYLVADRMGGSEDVRRTLAHEVVGHFSMREMIGDGYAPLLADVYKRRNESGVRRFTKEVEETYAGETVDVQAEEIVARMAEARATNPLMTRIIAAVRRTLRALGFRLSFTYDEIMGLLARAERRLRPDTAQQEAAEGMTPDAVVGAADDNMQARQAAMLDDLKEKMVVRESRVQPTVPWFEPGRPVETVFRGAFRILTAPVGGLTEAGNARIGEKAAAVASKVVSDMRPGPDGQFRWLDKTLEIVRHGWLNRYGTPKEFVARERQRFADEYEIMQDLVEVLQGLSDEKIGFEESKALQEVLEGKTLDDERLARLAKPIREKLDAYGKQLVEMGLLPEATWRRNLGEYLHRSYRQYEFDAPALVKWGRRRQAKRREGLRGDELMQRGRVHRVSMERLLKDVPTRWRPAAHQAEKWEIYQAFDAAGGIVKRVYKPTGEAFNDMEAADLFGETQADNMVLEGTWELRRQKGKGGKPQLWRDWTKEEREQMGEIRDARYNLIKTYELLAKDISTGRFFEDISQNENWFVREEPEGNVVDSAELQRLANGGTIAGVEWVKVPDSKIPKSNTKRWGALAGGYMRAAIWRDLHELEKMQNPGHWGWLLREWKKSKTSRSPTVHFNNFVGNIVLSELHDFSAADIIRGMREFANQGQYYREAVQQGVFGSGYVRTELNRTSIANVIDQVEKEVEAGEDIDRGRMQQVFDLIKRFDRKMGEVYQYEDEVFRIVSYMRDRHRGMLPAEAAQNAIDRFLNYDIRAPWPNALRRTVFPFLSYTYAFVPQWLKAMSNKPWKIAKIFALGYVLQELAYEVTDGDEDEERRVMADRDKGWTWAGLPKMLRLPFTDQGDPVYLGMTRILPGGGLADTEGNPAGLPEWMMVSGPMLTGMEMLLNRIGYTGEDLVGETDTLLEANEKRAAYLWRATMPNAPWIPGSWNWKMLERSVLGETDIFGRQFSLPVALIRQTGPRVYPHNVDAQRAYRLMGVQKDLMEYRRKMRELAMDRNLGRISQWAYDRGMSRAQEGIERLQERAGEIVGNSP